VKFKFLYIHLGHYWIYNKAQNISNFYCKFRSFQMLLISQIKVDVVKQQE
jgi:hypothetical protein